MKIVKIENNLSEVVSEASRVLSGGGVVVYPTDTAYGLGVNAMDVVAVNKLYRLKKRDKTKPTHVIVRDWEMIESLCETNELAKNLYDKHLPGPLTIVMKKKDNVLDELTGGLPTLGVRIPDNKFTRKLMNGIDFPVTTPSANRSGEPAPYSMQSLEKVLEVNQVDLIVDAGWLDINPPSTVLDLTGNKVKVLREGAIKFD